MSGPAFEHAFGTDQLARRPAVRGDQLRAWDAADELLLATLHELQPVPQPPLLIINDSFGALATALANRQPVSWNDSVTAHLALADNLVRNGHADNIALFTGIERPEEHQATILWRIPKSLTLLKQQMARIAPVTTADTLILAAGMDKHLPPRLTDQLTALGRVDMRPGRKKAHLFVLHRAGADALPEPERAQVEVPELALHLQADANVFARGQVDIGARFFLEQFRQLPPAQRIADLGCGNGILGIAAQRRFGSAQLTFIDDSYQAVASAAVNYRSNVDVARTPPAEFRADDGFSHYDGPPFDLVLCNPPFHQGHQVGDQVARRLFRQSFANLRPGGELWIVGNRHLGYHLTLKRLFGNSRLVAANPKFVVLAAHKAP